MNPARIGLNRIIAPTLPLEEFFALAERIGVHAVELRNDMEGVDTIDHLSPDAVREMAASHSLSILTINALLHFNLAARRTELASELRSILRVTGSIGAAAVVLIPHTAADDPRDPETAYHETVGALRAFAPYFEEAGLMGLVEPLGFPHCSLRSKLTALKAIRESGGGPYRIIHDTFHHALGPDDNDALATSIPIEDIGLVHISGVERPGPLSECTDGDRLLVTEGDRLESHDQITILERRGYQGFYSYEPFSPEVQHLSGEELATQLRASITSVTSI